MKPSAIVSQKQLEKAEACSSLAVRPITNQSHVPSLSPLSCGATAVAEIL